MARELVVLGTASQVPTRTRNHNGYFLRWDDEGILFDPGEGTQRQLLFAGVTASAVTRICLTHLHGDHCLGLPGVLQRMSLDGVERPVPVSFPATGLPYVERLRSASVYDDRLDVRLQPVPAPQRMPGSGTSGGQPANPQPPATPPTTPPDGLTDSAPPEGSGLVTVAELPWWRLRAAALRHRIDTVGWRVEERAGRTMLPERLASSGVHGKAIGQLQRDGAIQVSGRRVTLEEVSIERRGQIVAFVMDTAWCDGAVALAEGADLLVCESTFAAADRALADAYGHLTAADAGRLAAGARARRLVLTHFSQRYPDVRMLADEAASQFDGEVVAADDLMRVEVPPRRAMHPGASRS